MNCFTSRSKFIVRTLQIMLMILTALASIASADTFRGKIEKDQDMILITDTRSKRKFVLNFMSEVPSLQVKRLNSGDFISVSATVDTQVSNLLNVTSVDYIGLAALLGTWKSADGLCYDFLGYTTFVVYPPDRNKFCTGRSPLIPTVKYTYFISPDIEAWSLLLSSKDHELFGELKIVSPKNVEIQLFDSQTDDILGTIILRR